MAALGRGLATLLLLLLASSDMSIISYIEARGLERSEAEARALYDLWLAKHGGHAERFRVFWDNLRFVDAHNARAADDHDFRLGLNAFADLTNDEFRAAYHGARPVRRDRAAGDRRHRHDGVQVLPGAVDWRNKGAVAPVKNQGQCGSCWAFSAVSTIESINQLVTGEMVILSEQQLVDCSRNGGNRGCAGGWMDEAFNYLSSNGGSDTEKDYPYRAMDGECDINRKRLIGSVSIDGFKAVPQNDEQSLQKAVATQPVSVAIEAGGLEFQLYESGVFTGTGGTQLDHAVVAVGYGTENGTDYWIVRNSWGPDWGEAGYIRMERNISATSGSGKCGIAMMASYPTKTRGNTSEPAPTLLTTPSHLSE